MADKNDDRLSTFNSVVSILSKLDEEDRNHVIGSVISWFDSKRIKESFTYQPSIQKMDITSDSDSLPKEYLLDKEPQSNVERVACLAFYLTHYRDTPHFKTSDINSLNTEAAQPKFSNPTVAVNDASKARLLVASGKGAKQLSAMGEQFVLALPNRDQAKEVMNKMKPKRKKRKTTKKVKG